MATSKNKSKKDKKGKKGKRKKMGWKNLKQQSKSFKGGGRDLKWLKLKEGKNKILLVGPYKGDDLIANPIVFNVWQGGQLKAKATSKVTIEGEKDKIIEYGKKLKKKYKKSKNKALKELHRLFYPSFNDHYSCALDLNDLKAGVQIQKLPACALEAVHEADEVFSSPEDVFDLDRGHALMITAKGKGKKRKYSNATFLQKKAVALVEKGLVKLEDIMKEMYDLSLLQPEFDEKEHDKVFKLLKKQAQRVIDRQDEDADDGDDDDDDDDYDEDDTEEIDDDDDDDEDVDIEDDDDDDDDDDEDSDDEDDDDDDEDDKKSKSKKSKSKKSKGSGSKKSGKGKSKKGSSKTSKSKKSSTKSKSKKSKNKKK